MLMAGVTDGDFDQHEEHCQFYRSNDDGIACQIGQDGRLPRTWILSDNQSDGRCVNHNRSLLADVRKGTGSMDIR
jgi:hypothetical protein